MQPTINTLGELKKSGYQPISIKEELRKNLIQKLQSGAHTFDGIIGYDETVIPELQQAILSKHNILLLGLRGQAKTRIARLMVHLLDEYVPIVKGSELNDDPLAPISKYAINLINELGDQTPIDWLHRHERYTEKLATPDVSVSDLVGDSDPIKAANLKLPYSDERVIHFGLMPRAHRGIFVINELPDLQPRIQVALFNILQEKDIQIRGFKIRLPIDIQFVFTANPEDYTNRGSIVTPLKDRIESQIITHYPKKLSDSLQITAQEARLPASQTDHIYVPQLAKELIEQIAFEARSNEFIDPKSGVSARLTIAAYQNLMSTAERRMLLNKEQHTTIRISDFSGVLAAITGKIELVYEGEQEGASIVAQTLIEKAIRTLFSTYFPNPETYKKKKATNPYTPIITWFGEGNEVDILHQETETKYQQVIAKVKGLKEVVDEFHPELNKNERLFMAEFVLHALAEYSLISKNKIEKQTNFKDLLSSIFSIDNEN